MIGDQEALTLNIAIIKQAEADLRSALKTLYKCEKSFQTYNLAMKMKKDVIDFFHSSEFEEYSLGVIDVDLLIERIEREVRERGKE